MRILHVSAECYPMAKAGGLADVVGALPKYQNQLGYQASVVMPMHRTTYLIHHHWDTIFKGSFSFGNQKIDFTVIKEKSNELGFELYCVDINGLLDRTQVYGYDDDAERYLSFQIAVLEWMLHSDIPDLVHVHDHHAGLIPFLMQQCFKYRKFSSVRTILTIHNAQYQGWMDWKMADLLPPFDEWKSGLLEWDHQINSLACAVKCVNKVNTVSKNYMLELMNSANGLEFLFRHEREKCSGILNGIDYQVWNPEYDELIHTRFNHSSPDFGKFENKKYLSNQFGFDENLPLFIFIGRLVFEKSADLLAATIETAFEKFGKVFNFLVLGNGDSKIESSLSSIHEKCFGYYYSTFEFNEQLSHQMYAGADFLMMPSRVEPCGLNQMYAMRYGTIPIVRNTGGLKDTVIDLEQVDGYGIAFENVSVEEMVLSIKRAIELYYNSPKVNFLRKKMMTINNSWEKRTTDYAELYNSVI